MGPQELANTAWAFARAGQWDVSLFMGLARAAVWKVSEFNPQDLANTAWAFAMAGQPAPTMLDPMLVLDLMDARGPKPQVMYYQMLMQCVAATGQIASGFALLER